MSMDFRVPGILTCPPEQPTEHGIWYMSDYTHDMRNSPYFRCPHVWYWINIVDHSESRSDSGGAP